MNAKSLLEDLLQTGCEMAAKGQTVVEEAFDIPESGEKREAMISGLKTGAVAIGVMALLLGTHSGRRLAGSGLKLGSLTALGGIAWQAYKNWAAEGDELVKDHEPTTINNLSEDAANERSLLLLKAMIAAANSDGSIDEQEMASIQTQISELGLTQEVTTFLQTEIESPISIESLAAACDTPELAAEIYLVSSTVIDKENDMERIYLETLAAALELSESFLAALEKAKIAAEG